MATQSSILTWRIPWTKQPGGLQSVGFQRVGHTDTPAVHKGSLFSTFLPAFVISWVFFFFFFGNSHSYRCEVIFYCNFDLYFPDD